jgi:CheY-like chemotaxis protein
VTDDEPEMVRLLCRMLGTASDEYRFMRAYDGEQALAQMRQNRPDLVLLDLLMPQVGGLAILERMRADPALAGIPVVVVSAKGAFEAISPSAGRSLVLVADEPLPISRLLVSVRALLDALPPGELAGRPAI